MQTDPETAVATSLDGRRFGFEAPLSGHVFEPGGYVAIGGERRRARAGARVRRSRAATGRGWPRARARSSTAAGEAFTDAPVVPAPPERVAAWLERVRPPRAALAVGELALAPGVPLALDAGGFDRHTFLCGQSGSGKTYALGGVLERLLAETGLRLVILDPNSDHVRLGEVRDGVDPELARALSRRDAGRRRPHGRRAGREPTAPALRPPVAAATQAALLRLDPIADRDEYGVMLDLLDGAAGRGRRCAGSRTSPRRARRVRPSARGRATSGRSSWDVWAREDAGALDDELASRRSAVPRRRPRQPADARGAGARRRGDAGDALGRTAPRGGRP